MNLSAGLHQPIEDSLPFDTVAVVIPCYNEGPRVRQTILAVGQVLRSLPLAEYEILAINDGSADDTLAQLLEVSRAEPSLRVLTNDVNRGKGFTVRRGMLEAKSDLIAFIDADLSIPASEIARAFWWMNESRPDILIASRTVDGAVSSGSLPLSRVLMGTAFKGLVRALIGLGKITDSQCGFKCFTRAAAQFLFHQQTVQRYAFDVEILHLARQAGMTIEELPVTCINREMSSVSPVRDSIATLKDLLLIRTRHFRAGGKQ